MGALRRRRAQQGAQQPQQVASKKPRKKPVWTEQTCTRKRRIRCAHTRRGDGASGCNFNVAYARRVSLASMRLVCCRKAFVYPLPPSANFVCQKYAACKFTAVSWVPMQVAAPVERPLCLASYEAGILVGSIQRCPGGGRSLDSASALLEALFRGGPLGQLKTAVRSVPTPFVE